MQNLNIFSKTFSKLLSKLLSEVSENKEVTGVLVVAIVIVSSLGFLSLGAKSNLPTQEKTEVLGLKTENLSPTPSVTPTIVLTPTATQRTRPTSGAIPTTILTSTPTPTPVPVSSSQSTSTPTPTPIPTVSQAPTPTATPILLSVQVKIDYAGFSPNPTETYTVSIEPGQTAWDALKKSPGLSHINCSPADCSAGDYGVFITGFNGVIPDYNADKKFWLFKVNGVGASVGVSSYECENGDVLEFIITEG